MEKIRAKLNKIKEGIDLCEERELVAKNSLTEAKSRLEAAEIQKASFIRRITLLKKDMEKMNDSLETKKEQLDGLESKIAEDEIVVKSLENQEVEGDEKLETLNVMVKREQIEVEDYDLQCREASRKLQVLEKEVERAEGRYESNSIKVEMITESLVKLGSKIKSLEERESDQSERETDNEQKLAFLRDQEKEALVRAENAERDVARLGRVAESLILDIENWKNKKQDIIAEMSSVTSLADDI